MEPGKKDKSTPPWVSRILNGLAYIRADLLNNSRAIASINRFLTRPVNQTSLIAYTSRNNISRGATTSRGAIPRTTLTTPSLEGPSRPSSRDRRSAPSGPLHQERHQAPAQNEARPCWYHRQFGHASGSCIAPCNFMIPIPRIAPLPPLPPLLPMLPLLR